MDSENRSKGKAAIVAGVGSFLLGGMQYYFGSVCGEDATCFSRTERPTLFIVSHTVSGPL